MLGSALTSLFLSTFVPQSGAQPSAADLLDRLDACLATPEARAAHPFVLLAGKIQIPGMPEEAPFEERHAPAAPAGGHERVLVTQSFGSWGQVTQGTDGTASWTTDPALGVAVSRGEEQGGARRMWALARSDSWRAWYTAAEVLGETEKDGRTVLELAMTPRQVSSKTPERWYVDPAGPELVAVSLGLPNPSGGTLPMEFVYGDWKAVDGVRYPHRRVQKVAGMAITYVVTDVRHPDTMPAEALAPPAKVQEALRDPAKATPTPGADPEACAVRTVDAQHVASVRARVDATKVSASLAVMLPEVGAVLGEQGVRPIGPPFSRYHEIDSKTNTIDIEAGIPVATPITAKGRVRPGELPGGRVASTWHVGSYHELPRTYARLEAWMEAEALTAGGPFWEVYWTDPGIEPDPSTWKTEVLWPVE